MLNPNVSERAAQFLMEKIGKLDVQTAKDLAEGKLKLFDRTIYIRAEILATNEGIIPIGSSNQPRLHNVTNIDKFKLDAGEYFAAVGASMGYTSTAAAAADENDPATAGVYTPFLFDAASLDQRVPTGLVNADLNVECGNELILNKPCATFFKKGSQSAGGSEDDFIYELRTPKLFQPEKLIKWQLIKEAGVAIGADPIAGGNRLFVEIAFHGVGLGFKD